MEITTEDTEVTEDSMLEGMFPKSLEVIMTREWRILPILALGFMALMKATLAAVQLPGPLVEGNWLLAHQKDPGLVLLDIQERPLYLRHHIPGSVNLPYSQWRTGPKEKPPASLPPLERLAERLGALGITRQTPLVIVTTGQGAGDMAAAARVYWTLAVLGHEQMAVLDGGLIRYVKGFGGSFVAGAPPRRQPKRYEPRPRFELLVTKEQLAKGTDQPLLDARSVEEHLGLVAPPGDRPGTIPGAHNLPFDWLVGEDGRLRGREQIEKLFAYAGIPQGGAIHFCHTGNRAALTWFVDHALLGNQGARLYDGSMMEWAKDRSLPIERKLDL